MGISHRFGSNAEVFPGADRPGAYHVYRQRIVANTSRFILGWDCTTSAITSLGIPFPALPNLLLTATQLVDLHFYNIPRSGYVPPEAMATTLSALINLELLQLNFRYPPPRRTLGSQRPPPLTHSILPCLARIWFKGASEYSEEILARIDAPRLDRLQITFFNQLIFDTPQLFQFVSRRPTLRALEKGYITFGSDVIRVRFKSQISGYGVLTVEIPCTVSEWQLSSLEQICVSSLPPISALEDLYIFEGRSPSWKPRWQDNIENTLWLDLLRPFVAVRNLYLSKQFVPRIAPALEELVGGRTTEVLPTLKNIFSTVFQSSGPIHEDMEGFVAARRLTNHPVAVSLWNQAEEEEDLEHGLM